MKNIGYLIFLSTPIGNLGDITLRAIETLKKSSLIACEDTRRAKILLRHLNIKIPLISYNLTNEKSKTSLLVKKILKGEIITIISDAGTPCLSDPGYLISKEAIKNNIKIEIIPGVSALTFALVASGLPADNFHFLGFLSPKKGKRISTLEKFINFDTTLFIYESAFRINKLLNEITTVFGEKNSYLTYKRSNKNTRRNYTWGSPNTS